MERKERMERKVEGMLGGGDIGEKTVGEMVRGRGDGSIGGESGEDYVEEVGEKLKVIK
ncbi:hypothetical protein [Bacillus altitudinis]|uniref:hypothetical protein n=1 Tax=Bacillus altitudinis TaxID=293387 RepID=UPI001643950F|nr:hypothetical protein [Bacillus altitudinis]